MGAAWFAFFAAGALALWSLAAWMLWRRVALLRAGQVATGWVIGHESHRSEGDLWYQPQIMFTDGQGQQHHFTDKMADRRPRPAVGAQVEVLYLPNDPARLYVKGFSRMWLLPFFCSLLAGMLTAAAVFG